MKLSFTFLNIFLFLLPIITAGQSLHTWTPNSKKKKNYLAGKFSADGSCIFCVCDTHTLQEYYETREPTIPEFCLLQSYY